MVTGSVNYELHEHSHYKLHIRPKKYGAFGASGGVAFYFMSEFKNYIELHAVSG